MERILYLRLETPPTDCSTEWPGLYAIHQSNGRCAGEEVQRQEEFTGGVVCRPGMAIGDIVTDLLSLPTTGIPGKNRGQWVGLICWKQGGHNDCCDQ